MTTHSPATIAQNLNTFRQDEQKDSYDILTIDASGNPSYATYTTSNAVATLEDVQEVINRMAAQEWNKDKTFHIIKKTITTNYQVI